MAALSSRATCTWTGSFRSLAKKKNRYGPLRRTVGLTGSIVASSRTDCHDANGTASPTCERLGFAADGAKTIHAVDLAFFIRRGKYDLKHQLDGPIRGSRPLVGDDPTIVLKLYGISLTGGLTVIDLRAADIVDVPGEPDSPGCP